VADRFQDHRGLLPQPPRYPHLSRITFAAEGKKTFNSIAVKWWLTKNTWVLLFLPLGGGKLFDILKRLRVEG
jgi:hypothetical protein